MNEIINIALSFDAVIFGGYLRDVVVCGMDDFNDLDILWPQPYGQEFGQFVQFRRILELKYPGQIQTSEKSGSTKYGGKISKIYEVKIQNKTKLDCCIYMSTIQEWKNEHTVDFTCNLFYKTRDVQLGLRYIPLSYKYEPNPMDAIINLTKDRMYSVILDNDADGPWRKAARRGIALAHRGWKVQGEFMSEFQELGLTDSYSLVKEMVRKIYRIEDQKAVDAYVACKPEISKNCEEKIRRRLEFESDVSEDD
jgi:hypothetical protein